MPCCLEHCPIQSQVVRHNLIFQILCINSPLQVILLIVCVCVGVHIHACMCGQVYVHYHTCLHVWTGVCTYMPACVDRCMGHCVLGVTLVGQRPFFLVLVVFLLDILHPYRTGRGARWSCPSVGVVGWGMGKGLFIFSVPTSSWSTRLHLILYVM